MREPPTEYGRFVNLVTAPISVNIEYILSACLHLIYAYVYISKLYLKFKYCLLILRWQKITHRITSEHIYLSSESRK